MGYKDASIARTRWGQIKKKKILVEGTPAPSPTKVIKTKAASPRKKAGKKASKDQVDSGNEGADDEEEKSVKKERAEVDVKEEIDEQD